MSRRRSSSVGSQLVAVLIAILAIGVTYCAGPNRVQAADEARPIRALLVCGGAYHDYAKQKDILANGIAERANVDVTIAYDPTGTRDHKNPVYDNEDWAKDFDVIIHDECSGGVTDLDTIDRILKPHRDGKPAVVLHASMHAYRSKGWPKQTPWFEFTGLVTTGHGAQEPIAIHYVDPSSPITKGLSDWTTIHEELYNNAAGKLFDTAHALARGKQTVKNKKTGKEETSNNVVVWTNLYNGKTRVFATTIGHNDETVADPRYLDLVTRGLLWSVDKLDDAHLKPAKKSSAEPATNTEKSSAK